ncbi:MAG: T9SS type A sorting domain-containing protein [Flavobacteriales bacterium]|mgnify:CR=1 FL=1|nr:T9SS type A sorting domain-containing protein [Flavobacteriales bacterium]
MLRNLTLCLATASVISVQALTVTVGVQNQTCNYANGYVSANVSGGVPPYTYLWSGGETTSSLVGVAPGTYSVMVTDFVGTQASANGTVLLESYPPQTTWTHSYCPGQDYHIEFAPFSPPGIMEVVGPWTTSTGTIGEVPIPEVPGHLYLDLGQMTPGAAFDVTYWDVNGCPGSISGTVGDPILSWPNLGVLAVEGSCATYATGTVTVSYDQPVSWDSFISLRAEGSAENDFAYPSQTVSAGVVEFSSIPSGNYWLKTRLGITVSLIQGGPCMSDSIFVTVPDLGPQCGTITGSTFMDQNSDCLDTEVNAPLVIVEIQPGPYYSGGNGTFTGRVPNGSYTLTSSGPALAQSCPASATVSGNTVYANIGHQPTAPLDVSIALASSAARPGFQMNYNISVQNHSALTTGATTTTFTFDPLLTVLNTIPTPTSASSGTLTWDQPELGLFGESPYRVTLQVPPDVSLIGTVLSASATVSTTNTDADPSNNVANTSVTVTASMDPNEKVAATSSGSSDARYYIDQDEWIDYTLRFQNTGTDTAFNVVVTDTLPTELDPSSILIGAASHSFSWSLSGPGILRFMFPNILLPDSNVNEAASHGLVCFHIKPREPLLSGTVIENTANIYFDFNEPVITEPSLLVAEFSTFVGHTSTDTRQLLVLAPNPADDRSIVVATAGMIENLRIFSVDGRLASTTSINAVSATIGTSSLPEGAYILSAEFTDGCSERIPFSVVHP